MMKNNTKIITFSVLLLQADYLNILLKQNIYESINFKIFAYLYIYQQNFASFCPTRKCYFLNSHHCLFGELTEQCLPYAKSCHGSSIRIQGIEALNNTIC